MLSPSVHEPKKMGRRGAVFLGSCTLGESGCWTAPDRQHDNTPGRYD